MITDAVFITIYAVLAALMVSTTVSFAWQRMHRKLTGAYYGISGCLFGWLAATFVYHINQDPGRMEYLDNLAFPFIAFMPVAMLLFVMGFYRDSPRLRRGVVALLCVIPAITSAFSLVPAWNGLLRHDYVVLQIYPLHVADYTWNAWYYVHAGYSYALMALCGVVAAMQYKARPREYRLPSVLLIFGLGITYLGDLPSFNNPATVGDNTLIGVCISMLVLYAAIMNNPAVEFLSAARKALYNNLEMPVFILDRQDTVLDMNRAAHTMVEKLGVPRESRDHLMFGDIHAAIAGFGGQMTDGFVDDGASHILLPLDGENVVLNQIRRELTDKKGRPLGSYVAMMDVTRLSRMIDGLQSRAEIDALTGIPNRRAYEHRAAQLDTPENLPLTFIMGDVNKLKEINDKLGHRQGDKLLKTVAGALAEACPEEGFAARIGGDEFILVIPRCGPRQAQAVINDINARLEGGKKQFPGASIALGAVTKTRPGQNRNELIHKADQLMYSQKKYDRRRRAGPA